MKIALIIQNADRRTGGAEGYTLDLARSLGTGPGGRGHQVTVVAQRGPEAVAEGARAAGYQCVFLGANGRTRWARLQDFIVRLKGLYENHTYDIVHSMLPVRRCDVYQPHSGLASELLASGHMKHPGRVVQQFSRLANNLNPKRLGMARIEADMMQYRPWILCSSSSMRDFARKRYPLPEDRLTRLMNGIDLEYFDPRHGAGSRAAMREEWQIEEGQCLGLLVGNNLKLKGAQDAIEALARVRDPRLVIMVVGREDPAIYKRQADRLGVGESMRFVGRVSDIRTLYGAADFVLLPTRRDTCSLVVLEALAMGLPVITTLQNGASEVIEDGRQGILLDRGNPATLAKALAEMLNRARREAMAREALAMRHTLSLDQHVEKIESVYRQVISTRGHRQDAARSIAG